MIAPCICLILASFSIGAAQPFAAREIPGAVDDDADVDLVDHQLLVGCLTGPGTEPSNACRTADLDVDLAVTLQDYATLQSRFSGAFPHSLVDVGVEGGTADFERCRVAIPPSVFARSATVSITEMPRQEAEVATDLDPARYRPVGPVYTFRTPFFSTVPSMLTLRYDEADIPAGFQADNLAVLFRTEGVILEDPGREVSTVGPVGALFAVLPANVDTVTRSVSREIHGSGTYQLVAMGAPLDVWTFQVEAAASASAALAQPVTVAFVDHPSDEAQFRVELQEGISEAHRVLVQQKGFPAPSGAISIQVRELPGTEVCAGVSRVDPLQILVRPTAHCANRKNLAHEYFHVIQRCHTNAASRTGLADRKNNWFSEGTACWAMDEVFDGIPGGYFAPDGTRFDQPLNALGKRESYLYETVAFWKWFEVKHPGGIATMLAEHAALSGTLSPPWSPAPVHYLDQLTSLYSSVSFAEFAASALYWKNFDADENDDGDLWDVYRLGPPDTLPLHFQAEENKSWLGRGQPGDSRDNPHAASYSLEKHLTAAVRVIENAEGENALKGTLHVDFEEPPDAKVGATIISTESRRQRIFDQDAAAEEIVIPFGPGSNVVVIPVYPEWKSPVESLGVELGKFRVWVEPCGGPRTDVIWEASTEDQMIASLAAAAPGDTVRLAAGDYYPPLRTFPFGSGTIQARIVVPSGVALVGVGVTSTVIHLPWQGDLGNPWSLYLMEDASLQDLKIEAANNSIVSIAVQPVQSAPYRVSLCGVTVNYYAADYSWGFYFEPWWEGGRFLVEIQDTTLSCASCQQSSMTGVGVVGYDPSQRIDVFVRSSDISGWHEGLYYDTYSSTTVDADCASFTANTYGVYRCEPDACMDECPGGP